MVNQQSARFSSITLIPVGFIANQDRKISRSINHVDILQSNVADMLIGSLIADCKHELLLVGVDGGNIGTRLIPCVRINSVTVRMTYFLVIEPGRIIPVCILHYQGTQIYTLANQKRGHPGSASFVSSVSGSIYSSRVILSPG